MERAGIAARIVALMEAPSQVPRPAALPLPLWPWPHSGGAVSGSGPATVAALGLILIPGMVKAGYAKRLLPQPLFLLHPVLP